MKRLISAYNGQTRQDGYDATMRPVCARNNTPGGATYCVFYTCVADGHQRILWCDTHEAAETAVRWGSALDGEVI